MALIELKNVTVSQGELAILENVDLQVDTGEFVYLIGKVGSGKSSLLKTLYAELPLLEGQAEVAGFDLFNISTSKIPFLRRKIGIVFQDFQLLTDRNVHQNLLFVLQATGWKDKMLITERIKSVLEQVGLPKKEFKMPHELSGGEQQRIVIARALLNNPDIILADEPTGNLDPETTVTIINILYSLKNSGKSVIMATHNYSIIEKYRGRVLKCENGKLLN